MALMDTLLNVASQAMGNGAQGSMAEIARDLVQQQGGLGNLMGKLQQGGLGDALGSWVSTEQSNMPVSGSDLQNALGSDVIGSIAQKFGVDSNQAGDLLAQVLPNLVDSATPNGNAQEADGFGLDDIAGMLMKHLTK
ncbi:YidB family protein [Neisseria chenwenguii]|uniref:Uncharacterized protein n=1 Tax=Neisseria chenwenguii TaxID=1853278 RepID=A0A220RZM4_9NEIS|nr:YidB family protein [Neisseria chenwenguii]ASK26425.1 hypothetical protein BG910_00495 [Neisseria chenwenguii]ROV55847.1 DUF937 domain-containing protein [Neisseria chenwenguii]